MIVEISIMEIIPTCYVAAAMLPGGHVIHTSLTAKSRTDVITMVKQRFHTQKYLAVRDGKARWNQDTDKFEIKFIKKPQPGLFDGADPTVAAAKKEPAVWELVKTKQDDGTMTFSAKKHERPLMTETELKLALFATTVNNG